jgi:hypothetical protein
VSIEKKFVSGSKRFCNKVIKKGEGKMSEADLNGLIAVGAAAIVVALIVFAAKKAKRSETNPTTDPVPRVEEDDNEQCGC